MEVKRLATYLMDAWTKTKDTHMNAKYDISKFMLEGN
jgi:hypothetical protein